MSSVVMLRVTILMKFLLGCVIIPFFATTLRAQETNFLEATPPVRPDHAIWVGVDEARKNIPLTLSANSYTGKVGYLLSGAPRAEEGYFMAFPFHIENEESRELWIACSKIGAAHASPAQYYLDDVEIFPVTPIKIGQKTWGTSNAILWNRFGELKLKPGDHEFKIVIKKPRKLDDKYSIVLDAIALK